METNNSRVMLWSAALIAAGLVLLGWTLRSGIVHFKDSERVVTVKGLSEQEVKADRVIWPLMYKQVGDDLTVLYNNIEKTNGTIIAFLRSNGVDEKEITIAPSQLVDMAAELYNPNAPRYRYSVTTILTVVTDKGGPGALADAAAGRPAQAGRSGHRRRLPVPDAVPLHGTQHDQARHDRGGDSKRTHGSREIRPRFEKANSAKSARLPRDSSRSKTAMKIPLILNRSA